MPVGEKILRREVVVGITGTGDELNTSTFGGLIVEIKNPIKEMPDEDQVKLAFELIESSIATGLLGDPVVVKRGVHGVVLSERVVYARKNDDGKHWVNSQNNYASERFVSIKHKLETTFFTGLRAKLSQ